MTKPTPLRVVQGQDPGADFDRPLPHNIEAEQVVLGAVMLAPTMLGEVRELVDETSFYRPAHVLIWQTITALADRGEPYNVIPVGAALGRDLTKVGGGPYLHTLVSVVPTAVQAPYFAHIVRKLAYARKVIETGTRLAQLGYDAANDGLADDLRGAVVTECATVTAADGRGWPDPTALTAVRDLPPFPVWCLPDWIGEYAAGVAETTQTPPDLAGCLALAVLAVAAGGNVWISPDRDWSEPANLYVLVALGPGNRKSAVYAAMTAPIRAAEKILQGQAEPLIEMAAIERRVAEADAEKAEKAAVAATDPTARQNALADASAAAMALKEIKVPPKPRLFADDATVETLTSMLIEHGGRMAVLSPEGEIFSIAAGRYSTKPNFAVLKHGHAGEGMRIDRKTRESESTDAATITLGICTQPDVLADLGDTPQFRGQGLLGRLLYSVPVSLLGWRRARPEPIREGVAQHYATTLSALILELDKLAEPATLQFTREASEAVWDLVTATEPRFRPGGDLAHMTDWGGKYVGAVVRIAGLLHIAAHHRDGRLGTHIPIELSTFEAAQQIGEYFVIHAQAAYDTIGADPAVSDARAILQWVRNTRTSRFKASDILPSNKHRFKKVTDLDSGLRVLETHGWIRRLPTPPTTGRGRPSAPAYDAHPDALQDPT